MRSSPTFLWTRTHRFRPGVATCPPCHKISSNCAPNTPSCRTGGTVVLRLSCSFEKRLSDSSGNYLSEVRHSSPPQGPQHLMEHWITFRTVAKENSVKDSDLKHEASSLCKEVAGHRPQRSRLLKKHVLAINDGNSHWAKATAEKGNVVEEATQKDPKGQEKTTRDQKPPGKHCLSSEPLRRCGAKAHFHPDHSTAPENR